MPRDPRRNATGRVARRRVGRPPKLDRKMIAEAAHEIGLDGLTMKAVAERLGVSVPGLYHHVDGKDDLMRLAAEYSAGRIELPKDHGQHWAVWLYEWALYNRDAFVSQPELLRQYIEGAIGGERTAQTLEVVLARLVREGFSYGDSMLAYGAVSEYAVGAAVITIREVRAAEEGRPAVAEFHRVLAQNADEYPHLREMLAGGGQGGRGGFHAGLMLILRGICDERGDRWSTVKTKLQRRMQAA